ncbi:MAG: AtpZ/AtpI family protein [Alphaproteobacteria bacterium]
MVREGNIENKKSSRIDRDMQLNVSKKIDRKLSAKKRKQFVLRAFSLFGLVGWSVGVPTVICAYIGMYIDNHYPSKYISYTLYFILFGLVAGCYNAFRWVKREKDKLDKEYD